MYKSLIIIDDFYGEPQEVRQIALGWEYPEAPGPKNYPGRNSRRKLIPQGLDEVASQLTGERIVGAADEHSSHGRFRITLAGEDSRFCAHADPTPLYWVGVIYLTLPEHCQGGTAFFRHRGLDSERTPLSEEELRPFGVRSMTEFMEREGARPESWEHVMTVPMRYNRMILYRPWMWHAATAGFGERPEDARLIQMLGFLRG